MEERSKLMSEALMGDADVSDRRRTSERRAKLFDYAHSVPLSRKATTKMQKTATTEEYDPFSQRFGEFVEAQTHNDFEQYGSAFRRASKKGPTNYKKSLH